MSKKSCRTMSLVLLVLLGLASQVRAANVAASTCSLPDVSAAVAAASNGDTVTIPAGTCTWTSILEIDKAITLQGSGVGSTLIRDGVATGYLMVWRLVAGQASRMTGIEFQDGGRGTTNFNGIIGVSGANTDDRTMRIDNCKFDHLAGAAIRAQGMIGVIDHNEFLSTPGRIPILVFHFYWDGGEFGDGSWADSTNWGGSKFTFIEDNTFTNNGPAYAIVDGYAGSRVVFRYNTVNSGLLVLHGTESSGPNRGGRAMEVYGNMFNGGGSSNTRLLNLRSGAVLVYDNTATNYAGTPRLFLTNHRNFYQFSPWGMADGTNQWDLNDPDGPFESGTSSGGGSLELIDASKNWATNQWSGYVITKTGCAGYCGGEILSNTATSIAIRGTGGHAQNISFGSGEGYVINRVLESLDQPCRAGGSRITRTGSTPIPPIGWNDQYDEPCHEWNNTFDGQDVDFSAGVATLRAGEHYLADQAPSGYSPYLYPHPLVSGSPPPTSGDAPPDPPTNVRIVCGG